MKRNVLTQYLIITASCALYAVGFNWMFDPNHISVGGFTGLGQIINYLAAGRHRHHRHHPQRAAVRAGLAVHRQGFPVLLYLCHGRQLPDDRRSGGGAYLQAYGAHSGLSVRRRHHRRLRGIMLREGATTGGTELAAPAAEAEAGEPQHRSPCVLPSTFW